MAIAGTTEHAQAQGWLLVLDPPVVPPDAGAGARPWMAEPILGLPVLVRLALTAQSAGATGIALSTGAALRPLRGLLADARLRIPVTEEADRPSIVEFRMATPSVRLPANTVIHKATLLALKDRADEGEVDVSFSGAP